ncbi:MAG: hypothetical protein KDK30_18640, partial [Leptospiraceae bacterium]|nr:hypothetical protein [Leptospiraceae bacterium]
IGTGTAPNLTPLPLGYPGGQESTSIQIPENALPAHTHSGSFNSADLNNNAAVTVDLNSSYVTGTVNCNFLAGGSTNPAGQYPGYDGSVGAWSNVTNNSLMASDVVTDGSISNIDITNNFNSNNIPVIVVQAGDDQAIEHSSIPPFLTVNYLITVDGLFPPHPSPPPSQIHAESGADV